MALSYLGVDITPKYILDSFSDKTTYEHKWGVKFYDATSPFEFMLERHNSNTNYSPPIIHLDNYSVAGHYVIIVGKIDNNSYVAVNPNRGGTFNINITNLGSGNYRFEYLSKTEETDFIHSKKVYNCICQYYNK